MRRGLLPAVLAALAIAGLAALAASSISCGPSPAVKARDALVLQVGNLMTEDQRIWSQIRARVKELNEDPSGPTYYPYLESTAAPFYAEFERALGAMRPAEETMQRAHAELVKFAAARRRFVRLEMERRLQAGSAKEILKLIDKQDDASRAMRAYEGLVDDDDPDARRGAVVALDQRLHTDFIEPAVRGETDLETPARHLREVVLPKLRELREGRFDDDAKSKAIRKAIVLQEEAMTALDALLVPVLELKRTLHASEKASAESEDHLTAFRSALAEAGRR